MSPNILTASLKAVVSAANPLPPAAYHARLKGLNGLSHVTVEVQGLENDRV